MQLTIMMAYGMAKFLKVNPPYSASKVSIKKSFNEWGHGCNIALLIKQNSTHEKDLFALVKKVFPSNELSEMVLFSLYMIVRLTIASNMVLAILYN